MPQALKHFLRCQTNDAEAALDMAIETVGKAKSEELTHSLIEFLMGEPDGVPKVVIRISKGHLVLRLLLMPVVRFVVLSVAVFFFIQFIHPLSSFRLHFSFAAMHH